MTGTDTSYILGRTEAELARLRTQSERWAPLTERVLDRAGLEPGMTCLDVGCGPGDVMRLMLPRVGPAGRVTGLDLDADLGARVIEELRADWPNVAFVPGDIARGDPIPAAPFDFVFARLLLIHMTDPVAAVRRLAALTRPGGRLVLMDYDNTRMACRPDAAAASRAVEIVVACFERSGKHADCGLRLAGYLEAAGLPPPDGAEMAGFYEPFASRGAMLRAALVSLTPSATALGVADHDELAALDAELRRLEGEAGRFALGPLMIGVWTTIPG